MPLDPSDPNAEVLVGVERARELLGQGMTLFVEADEALREGDLATYQEKNSAAQTVMQEALEALELEE